MPTATKFEQSETLRTALADVSALVLISYDGMSVTQTETLRAKLREAGCRFRVYKNSTVQYAVKGTRHEAVTSLLAGTTGLAYHPDDPGAPARVVVEFAKEKDNDKCVIKGGVMEGAMLDAPGVERLAAMPGPRELKSMLLNVFLAPATKMVRLLNTPAQNLLNVLNAKKEKDGG